MDRRTPEGMETRLADLAHEMRTPLNAVMGFAQVLRASETDAARAAHAARIVEGAAELASLIDRMAGLGRAGAR